MGWERRAGGGRYYYRGRRTPDGRVVKQYLGRGERAEAAAAEDALPGHGARTTARPSGRRWPCSPARTA